MTVTKEFALEIFGYNRFKKQILSSVKDEITLYRCGDFIDLCRGPHLQHTGKIKVRKILRIF
jgi:threonyl-tRNA synthetase